MSATYWLEPDSNEADNIGPDPEPSQDDDEGYHVPACGGAVWVESWPSPGEIHAAGVKGVPAEQNVGCQGCPRCLVSAE